MRIAFVVVLVTFVLGGCNRLTFLKPDPKRGSYRQVAENVDVSGGERRERLLGLVQVAQSRLLSGDAKAALDASSRALKVDDRSAEAQSLYALSLDALGRDTESGRHHQRATELAPQVGSMWNNYGIWLCTHGRADASLEMFDRAAASPGYATPAAAIANGASCAARAGQNGRAMDAARRVLDADPVNPVALATMARVHYAMGNGLEARAFIERRLAVPPVDEDALMLASQIETLLGDTVAAARYVQRIKAEFPRGANSSPQGGKP